MATSAIDLSAGLQPAPAPPAGGAGIDLSAGLKPSVPTNTSPPAMPNPSNEGTYLMTGSDGNSGPVPYSRVTGAIGQGYKFGSDDEKARYNKDAGWDPRGMLQGDINVAKGFGKSVMGAAATLLRAAGTNPADLLGIRAVAGLGDTPNPNAEAADWLDKHTKNTGENPTQQRAQDIGSGIEKVAEFMIPEAKLAEMTTAEKLKELGGITSFLEKHPVIAKTVVTALRNGVVGAGQSLLHGGSAEDALTEGALAAGTAGTLEGGAGYLGSKVAGAQANRLANEAADAFDAARPDREAMAEQQAANEAEAFRAAKAQRVQTAEQQAANEAEAFRAAKAQRVQTEEQQAAAQKAQETAERQKAATQGLVSVAQKAAEDATDRFNAASQPRVLNDPAAIERGTVALAAKPAEGSIQSVAQAADHVREMARPVFDAVDDASDGELSKLQKQRSSAFVRKDFAAVEEAESQIEGILNAHPDVASPREFKAARSAWADSKVLDRVHYALEGAYNGVPEDTAAREGIERTLNGRMVRTRFSTAIRKVGVDNVDRVLGQQGRDNVFRVAHLLEQPSTAQSTKDILDTMGDIAKPRTKGQILDEMESDAPPRPAKPEKSLGDSVQRHLMNWSVGASLAAGAAHATGAGGAAWVAAPLGGAVMDAAPKVLSKIAASPQAGVMLDYAVNHGIPAKRAAQLITAVLAQQGNADNTQQQ